MAVFTLNGRLTKFVAGLILLVLAYIILKELQSFLIPFFISLILFFLFEPLHNSLCRGGLPAWASILLILLIIVLIANLTSAFVVASANSFTEGFPQYEAKLYSVVHSFLISLNFSTEEILKMIDSLKISNLIKEGSVTSFLTGVVTSVVSILGDFFLILIYLVFLFSEMTSIRGRIKRAFPNKGKDIDDTFNFIFGDIKKYLIGKTFINIIQGVIFGLILWIFGVDFALLWGFLSFLAHYIPNIGSLLSTILPFLTALLQFDNIVIPIMILVILILVQNIIGNVFEPIYLGDQLDLSPLMILIALIFWGYVWGILGMILAVPILVIIKIVLTRIEETKPLAILLSYKDPDVVNEKRKVGEYMRNKVKARRNKNNTDNI